MKTASIIAVSSFALANLVGAAPVNDKRKIVYATSTEDVWETYWTTTTVWVNPTAPVAAPTTASVGGFWENNGGFSRFAPSSAPSSAAPVVVASSSEAPVVVASSVPTPEVASVPTPEVTSVPTPEVAPVAPTTTSVYVAPIPTTTAVPAPVAPTTTTAAAPAETKQASTGSGAASGANVGDMTYYDVSVGLGSCGKQGSNDQPLVAMNHIDMANGINPNANPHCGQKINIIYDGKTTEATVLDTCPGCAKGSIDVTDSLFKAVAPNGDGRVKNVSWSWA